jgi:hypothetical protein
MTNNVNDIKLKHEQFKNDLTQVLNEFKDFLIKKNKSYGDSALNPINVFSKTNSIEQIRMRIDDKINRLMQGHEFEDDDTIKDLTGYLLLLNVAIHRKHLYENPFIGEIASVTIGNDKLTKMELVSLKEKIFNGIMMHGGGYVFEGDERNIVVCSTKPEYVSGSIVFPLNHILIDCESTRIDCGISKGFNDVEDLMKSGIMDFLRKEGVSIDVLKNKF